MNLKEYIRHIKSICKQGILRHKNVILDETFQKELLEIIKCYEQLQQENQALKKQLEENEEEIKKYQKDRDTNTKRYLEVKDYIKSRIKYCKEMTGFDCCIEELEELLQRI